MTEHEQWVRDYNEKNSWRRDLPPREADVDITITSVDRMVAKKGGLTMNIYVATETGLVKAARSPDRACFAPTFLGQPWTEVRQTLTADGFTIEESDR